MYIETYFKREDSPSGSPLLVLKYTETSLPPLTPEVWSVVSEASYIDYRSYGITGRTEIPNGNTTLDVAFNVDVFPY